MADFWPTVDDLSLSPYIMRVLTVDEVGGATTALDSAKAAIENYTRQTFEQVTETLTVDGSGTPIIALPSLHVSAVTSVAIGSTVLVPDVDYDWFSHGVLRCLQWPGVSVSDWGSSVVGSRAFSTVAIWPAKPRLLTVNLTHGYVTLPADVFAVCLSVAGRIFNNPQGVLRDKEEVAGVYLRDTQYARTSVSELTDGEKAQMERYKPLVAA